MTPMQEICSTPDQILMFLREELSSHKEAELQLHLNHCESCRTLLEETAADVDSWQEAKRFLGHEPVQDSLEDSADAGGQSGRLSLQIRQVLESLAPTDDPEMLGRIGGYEVSGVIGAGGMGVVLKAHDRSLDRIVAVKVMAPHLASSGSARKRFAREAKAAAAVIHPNVIAIHGVSNDGALPYLVMPFVGGNSLQRRLDQDGPLPAIEVLRVGSQIAAGLAAAHGQGLVHRDIKPANIMLDSGVERVSITDFGLARAVDDASMTRTGVIAGTPQFMSPEQARGAAIDHRSDLFSLGSVMYAMCTGRPPFRAETSYGVLRRITDDESKPIREVNADIPAWLCHIVSNLMRKSPDERFSSAAEVAELLEDCLAHVQQPTTTPLPAGVQALAASSMAPARNRLKAIHQHIPPIGKLVAAAAFAFSLIFAGVLIVLELNKGTLSIESEADDVPIRIMQGDDVVEKLTVTKSGSSVRIAAGTYTIEVDGEFEGISLKDNIVSLKRSGTETVRIFHKANAIENGETLSRLNGPYNFRTSPQYKALSADDRGKLDAVHNDFNLLWGALHRFASEHNDAVPMSLEDLVPRYLKSLPKDPFATAITAAKTDLGIYRSSLGGCGYHYCRGKGQSWIVASVGLPDFPYLAERGNVGLYLPKGRWISKSLDFVPPLHGETSAEHGKVENQIAPPAHAKTVSNLTRLMAALHQYHEDKGNFPPASILGKDGDGGPPHSWRVEILPWLGEHQLYDEYRFDEAWDGAHNKTLLSMMPNVFRCPLDSTTSVNTSYFGVVPTEGDRSRRTFFMRDAGSKMQDMTDGTSNVIALVEAKRDVPWTRPFDFEFENIFVRRYRDFGGWFDKGWHAGFADGTAKFLATENELVVVECLLMSGDGNHVVPHLVKRLEIREADVVSEPLPMEKRLVSKTAQRPGGPLLRWMTHEPPMLCEDDIVAIELNDDPANKSSFQVKITLSDAAGKRLLAETTRMCEQSTPEHSPHLVILIDGSSVSEPRVVTAIGDKLVISGLTDREQAQAIVSHVRRTIALANQAIDEQHASEPVEAGAATIPVIPNKVSGHEIGEDEEEVSDTLSRSEAAPANRMETEIASYNESTKALYPNLADSPLTPEELIAWASWYVERDVDLSPGMKTALGTIAQEHRLPFNLTFRGGVQELLACEPPVGCYRISVHDEETNEMMAIRERFVKPSKGSPKPNTSVHYEGTRLAAAVKRFNARYREINGQRQLPLTEDEVVAAILYEQTKRDGADVSDSLFESLQNIAHTRTLPEGTELDLIPTFGVQGGSTYTIWSIRVKMPQNEKGREGWTYAFEIRKQFISVKHGNTGEIHWGKPAENGLQAGVRISPPLQKYKIGQQLEIEIAYRNIFSEQLAGSLPNFLSYDKVQVHDAAGVSMTVIDREAEKIVGGWRGAGWNDQPQTLRGRPIALVTEQTQQDSFDRRTLFVVVQPGQTYTLQFAVGNYADGAEGSIETGQIEFSVLGPGAGSTTSDESKNSAVAVPPMEFDTLEDFLKPGTDLFDREMQQIDERLASAEEGTSEHTLFKTKKKQLQERWDLGVAQVKGMVAAAKAGNPVQLAPIVIPSNPTPWRAPLPDPLQTHDEEIAKVLTGTWDIKQLAESGKDLPFDEGSVTFGANVLLMRFKLGDEEGEQQYMYRIFGDKIDLWEYDPEETQMDRIHPMLGSFRLDNNTLRICHHDRAMEVGQPQPRPPLQPGNGLVFLELQRKDDHDKGRATNTLSSDSIEVRVDGRFGTLKVLKPISLMDAVSKFNEMARTHEIGRDQPELTAEEVVGAFRLWVARKECNEATRKDFQQVIDSQALRPGHVIQFNTQSQTEGHLFAVWAIQFGDDESYAWFKIRSVTLISRLKSADERKAWEKAKDAMAKSFRDAKLSGQLHRKADTPTDERTNDAGIDEEEILVPSDQSN